MFLLVIYKMEIRPALLTSDFFFFGGGGGGYYCVLPFKIPPNRRLASMKSAALKNDKTQITYHFCCDVDGLDMLPPLMIGISKKPCAFGHHPALYYVFNYKFKSSAW